MPYATATTFLVLLITRATYLVAGQGAQLANISPTNGQDGFSYYCSDQDSPPLCNADCNTAINNICHEDLHNAMNETVNSCQVLYLPAVFPWWRNGARGNVPGPTECINNLNSILANSGRDAGTTNTGIDSSYCTEFGGGGTWGWNDDGTPLSQKARYVITTPSVGNQCGQTKALWWQTNKVVAWDSSELFFPTIKKHTPWLSSNPTVQLIDAGPLALPATGNPTDNPTCNTEVCDIFVKPVYAISGGVWTEKGSPGDRHRIQFEGIDGKLLQSTLNDRCGQQNINNLQLYANASNTGQWVIDLNLPDRLAYANEPGTGSPCPCIADAVFDASGGAVVSPVNLWCDSTIVFKNTAEFPIEGPGSKLRRQSVRRKRDLLHSRFL
ncbi:uncharacterized protein KY384_008002 [Bacidia gigantensis]|uniref:uncharacterized protein n=1 Tax=Bacidia gigantensis TaxID=2732470 RepID=UPI001D038E69|nr:uncharacterized protein KY384_008002 [Bacidia gigantensis]KAG8527258.1 hypothetical protein KY384_008002 [Bacidia gigantensis]